LVKKKRGRKGRVPEGYIARETEILIIR
jgi:hypothetical protein